jgi:RNA polymerase subunit RPABC4/transcription elongation factor Spt4
VPSNLFVDFQRLSGVLLAVVAVVAAAGTAIWISLIIWTYRDMRARSRDVFAQVLAAIVVGFLNIPGFMVYLILRPRETLAEQYERALEEEALLQSIEEKKVCPGCGHPTKEEWRLCPYCHTRLKKPCENCMELLDLPWSICPYCEYQQPERSTSARRAARSEPVAYDPAPYPDSSAFLDESGQQ